MTASVTWVGHASAVIEIGGERVVVDPLGRRRTRDIEDVAAVLITHAHVDHLNRWTLKKLAKEPPLIVPRGAGPIVRDLGFSRVQEVEPGDQLSLSGLDITVVATRHDNGRWRKGDLPLCVGYVVERNGIVVHHAGDVDFSDFSLFEHIGARHKITATMLPIGGLLPVWYYRRRRQELDRGIHIDPDTAIDLAQRLGAKTMIPIHWGTVNLRLGPSHAPRQRLEKVATHRGMRDLLCVLDHGDRWLSETD